MICNDPNIYFFFKVFLTALGIWLVVWMVKRQ